MPVEDHVYRAEWKAAITQTNFLRGITLSNLCQELEAPGRAGTLAGAAKKVAQAETEYEQVKTALEAVRR